MKICLATIHAYQHSLPLALMYLKANLVDDARWANHGLDAVCGICFRKGGAIIETVMRTAPGRVPRVYPEPRSAEVH